MRKWTVLLGGLLLATASGAGEEEVHFFFSPDAPGPATARAAADYVRRAPRAKLRPCLIVEDLRTPVAPGPEFLETVRAIAPLGPGISIYDPEGVALARKFGVRRLPAVVVVRGERIHVNYGANLTVKEIGTCWK